MRITGWDQSQLPLVVEIVRCQTQFFPQNRGFITIMVMHSSRFSSALTMALYINPKSLNITVYCLPNILKNWNSFLFGHLVKIQISNITELPPEYAHNLLKELQIELNGSWHILEHESYERGRHYQGLMTWTRIEKRKGKWFDHGGKEGALKMINMIIYDNMIIW